MTPTRSRLVALFAAGSLALPALAQVSPPTTEPPAPPRPTQPEATATTEPAAPKVPARDDRAAEQLGWQLGVQAWTFRDRTAFEAIDTAAALGLRYIELYPGQRLSPAHGDAKVGPEMAAEHRTALQQKLAAARVRAMAFGVVGFANDEAKSRPMFAFAKELGIGTITCEPDPDAWDVVEKLAVEFGIQIACHDHPKPSRYWNPETVLAAVKNRNALLGACADTGHWPRSGVDTVAALRTLAGRIKSLHFKDIAPADPTGEDQPWGTGQGKATQMLTELQRQGFQGLVSIEYETGRGKPLENNVRRCIEFFDGQCRALVAAKGDAGK
ncbi:MAG: sugar phosphate isomerase/epimerase [Planctomycetes bacterium]|nr:sugar phosphate isomerase/epimerase [Planctomycetota bacterium]